MGGGRGVGGLGLRDLSFYFLPWFEDCSFGFRFQGLGV